MSVDHVRPCDIYKHQWSYYFKYLKVSIKETYGPQTLNKNLQYFYFMSVDHTFPQFGHLKKLKILRPLMLMSHTSA
jgi:hypothetical protein